MGASQTTANLQDAVEKQDLRRLKEVVNKSSDAVVKKWLLEGKVRGFCEEDVSNVGVLEYCAGGFLEPKVLEWMMHEFVSRGVIEELVCTEPPGYVMKHVLAPAVRRDLLSVTKALLSVTKKVPSLLNTAVLTRYGGSLILSSIVHLAAEQNAIAVLPCLLDAAAQHPPLLSFLLSRVDGAGNTIRSVATPKTLPILEEYFAQHAACGDAGVAAELVAILSPDSTVEEVVKNQHRASKASKTNSWFQKIVVWDNND